MAEGGMKCRGRVPRQRGDRAEREVVKLHRGPSVSMPGATRCQALSVGRTAATWARLVVPAGQ